MALNKVNIARLDNESAGNIKGGIKGLISITGVDDTPGVCYEPSPTEKNCLSGENTCFDLVGVYTTARKY